NRTPGPSRNTRGPTRQTSQCMCGQQTTQRHAVTDTRPQDCGDGELRVASVPGTWKCFGVEGRGGVLAPGELRPLDGSGPRIRKVKGQRGSHMHARRT
uniref:Uncharacterized protein n=1 Tax=Electrophorus electricus TaxID=8005 RepID=A0A4W4GS95_ELEEL